MGEVEEEHEVGRRGGREGGRAGGGDILFWLQKATSSHHHGSSSSSSSSSTTTIRMLHLSSLRPSHLLLLLLPFSFLFPDTKLEQSCLSRGLVAFEGDGPLNIERDGGEGRRVESSLEGGREGGRRGAVG